MQPLETGKPYYIVPDVELYKTLDPESEEARILSRKIAANVGDLASLRLILGIDPPEFARFYPDMNTPDPDTFDTIDAFLEKFGSGDPLPLSLSEISMEDYTEETPENDSRDLADEEVEEIEADFAILIKKHRYKEALMLIERQNLKNPEKSIYFAHQMRFLKKLIAIENYRNQSKGGAYLP